MKFSKISWNFLSLFMHFAHMTQFAKLMNSAWSAISRGRKSGNVRTLIERGRCMTPSGNSVKVRAPIFISIVYIFTFTSIYLIASSMIAPLILPMRALIGLQIRFYVVVEKLSLLMFKTIIYYLFWQISVLREHESRRITCVINFFDNSVKYCLISKAQASVLLYLFHLHHIFFLLFIIIYLFNIIY